MRTKIHVPPMSPIKACCRLNRWTLATGLLLGLLCVTILFTVTHYGDSYDEHIRSEAGEEKLSYYTMLLSGDFDAAQQIRAKGDRYPGFHDLNLAILRRISPFSDFTTGNLFSAFLGFLAIMGAIQIGRMTGGPQAGFWTGLLLTTTPVWYGHMFINPKDIPFAFGYIWSLVASIRWLQSEKPTWNLALLTGLAFGMAMACRVGGLLMFCYLGLFLGIGFIIGFRRSETPFLRFSTKWLQTQIPRLAVAALVAFAILLIYWPAAQANPFAQTSKTLEEVTDFQWKGVIFFNGIYSTPDELPFYYILVMFLIKMPLITLALFFGGACFIMKESTGNLIGEEAAAKKSVPQLLILFSVLFPVAYVILKDSILYNGLRHLLFIVPPACVIAGIALEKANGFLQQRYPRLLPVAGYALALVILGIVVHMVRLHPYQYVSYNALAGGTKNAAKSYELDYWGTVYKELAEEFYAHLVETRPEFSRPNVIVSMETVTWLFRPFLPEETSLPIVVVRYKPEFDDYYASSVLWGTDRFYHGEIVVEVKRVGTRLGVIRDRRNLNPQQRRLRVEENSNILRNPG